jgi:hypothetical protein
MRKIIRIGSIFAFRHGDIVLCTDEGPKEKRDVTDQP